MKGAIYLNIQDALASGAIKINYGYEMSDVDNLYMRIITENEPLEYLLHYIYAEEDCLTANVEHKELRALLSRERRPKAAPSKLNSPENPRHFFSTPKEDDDPCDPYN